MSGQNESREKSAELDTVDESENTKPVAQTDDVEWQKAEHSVSEKNLQAAGMENPLNAVRGQTGSIKQKLEDDVVLDYLANQIYGGPAETIKEYLANAETACIRAAELDLRENSDYTEEEIRAMSGREVIERASYSPTIEVEWHKDEDMLIIQDNGIGFTPGEIIEVLAWTGRSGGEIRDRGDVSGKFGMGVLSAHNAVGKEGSYTLHTRTRRDVDIDIRDLIPDDQPIPEDLNLDEFSVEDKGFSVYAYLGGYDPMDNYPPDGFYGSRFELPLMEGIEEEHSSRYDDEPVIRKWTRNKSEWMRVPVLYSEFDDGETVFDDEWGEKQFAEGFDGAILTMDRDEFYSVCYPQADNETLLLSIPIDRNHSRNPDGAPWSVDIRFRSENGNIVQCNCEHADRYGKPVTGYTIPAGPNEGKIAVPGGIEEAKAGREELVAVSAEADVESWEETTAYHTHKGLKPVEEGEYGHMDAERQKNFVPKTEVRDDVKLPTPTANREELNKNSSFWNWLGNEFGQMYRSQVSSLANKIEERDDLVEMAGESPNDFSFLMVAFGKFKGYRTSTAPDLQDEIENSCGVKLTEEVCETILILLDSVQLAPRGRSGVSKKHSRTEEKVWRLLRESEPDGQVYIGATINEDRCSVAWETHDDNQVAWVDGVAEYDKFQEHFDWGLLKDVPMSPDSKGADQFTLPEKLKTGDTAKNNSGKDAANRKLTVRVSSGRRKMANHTADQIKTALEEHYDNDNGDGVKLSYSTYANKIVLFPSNTDKSMSEWYDVTSNYSNMAVAKCTVNVYEYLEDVEGIMHIDDLLQESKDTVITTNEGDMTVEEAGNNLIVHVVDADYIERFREQRVMDSLASWLHEYLETRTGDIHWSFDDEDYPDKFIYAPVGIDAWKRLYPSNLEQNYIVIGGNVRPTGGDWTYQFSSDARIYANGRLYKWDNETPEVEALDEISSNTDADTAFAMVDTLAMLHDSDIEPASKQETTNLLLDVIDQPDDDDEKVEAVADGGEQE